MGAPLEERALGTIESRMDKSSPKEMLDQVREIENLVSFADVPGNMTKASALALSIARKAPDTIAARALELLEAVNTWERSGKCRARTTSN